MAIPDNGPLIVAVTWFLCFFSGAFLALRLYAKLSRRHELWWDDHILIFSWLLLLVQSIITQVGQLKGFGRHIANIPVQNLSIIALGSSIAASISCFAATGSKISFGFTLLRLTEGPWRGFMWFCIVTLFLVMLPSALFTWVQCTPREKAWNTFIEGTCWDPTISTNYGVFNAAWCAAVDFALALLPWKIIWHLRLKTREKIGVGIAMSMGVLSGICAIVKGVYMIQLRQQDFYYNGKDVTIWTSVETATAIVAASIPVLRVFFKDAASTLQYHISTKDTPLPTLTPESARSTATAGTETPHSSQATMWMSGSRHSEESILRDDRSDSARSLGILQTNTVTIRYEDRSSGEIA